MRTTSDIDDNLLGKMEERACKTQRTLTGIIEEVLKALLDEREGSR